MDKRYAIFDMDGTLIDSMPIWRSLGEEYLRAKGVTQGIRQAVEDITHLTASESAELFVRRFGMPESPLTVVGEMNRMMEAHYRRDIPLKRGVRQLLERLRSDGVQLCVASATEEYLMAACLERLGILELFSFILSCETLQTSKREPRIYLEAARRFGAEPGEIAVYEDALYAAKTAKAAGFSVAAVYDRESEEDWEQLRALADEVAELDRFSREDS